VPDIKKLFERGRTLTDADLRGSASVSILPRSFLILCLRYLTHCQINSAEIGVLYGIINL
jgi:hypothetical protein